ncbi:MAG: hypothetical protein EA399_13770 [Desulfovibrionales bacterium]|nr:MAG: hypothetical protein EA399_13770 [Desulfovibrionales bacterium]
MMTRQFARTLLLCLGFTLFLVVLNALLPPQTSAFIFSESGPFEMLSFILWFVLATTVLLVVRPRSPATLALAVLATVAGLRELGVNSLLTTESITRISYYLNPDIFWLERLAVVGFIACLGLAAIAILVIFGRWLIAGNGAGHPTGQIILLAVVLVPVTKVLDRLPAYLRGFLGIEPSLTTVSLLTALEEGLEMILPILFLQALFLLPKALPGGQEMDGRLHRI